MRCTAINKSTGRQCKYEIKDKDKRRRKCGVHASKSKSSRKHVNLLPTGINETTSKQTILEVVIKKAKTADKSVLLKALDVLNIESLDDDAIATTTTIEKTQPRPLDDEVLLIRPSSLTTKTSKPDKINIRKMRK